eukprot:1269305-Rhodomonas_salina.1
MGETCIGCVGCERGHAQRVCVVGATRSEGRDQRAQVTGKVDGGGETVLDAEQRDLLETLSVSAELMSLTCMPPPSVR